MAYKYLFQHMSIRQWNIDSISSRWLVSDIETTAIEMYILKHEITYNFDSILRSQEINAGKIRCIQ